MHWSLSRRIGTIRVCFCAFRYGTIYMYSSSRTEKKTLVASFFSLLLFHYRSGYNIPWNFVYFNPQTIKTSWLQRLYSLPSFPFLLSANFLGLPFELWLSHSTYSIPQQQGRMMHHCGRLLPLLIVSLKLLLWWQYPSSLSSLSTSWHSVLSLFGKY